MTSDVMKRLLRYEIPFGFILNRANEEKRIYLYIYLLGEDEHF